MFGSSLRATWTRLLAVSLLFALGCGDKKANDLAFNVSFVCAEDQAATDTLELHVIEGGCNGTEYVYEASLSPGQEAPVGKGIDPGLYGFEAIASGGGEALATGCVEASLPSSEAPTIELRSDTCTEPAGEDAGDDAAHDADEDASADDGGTEDASDAMDADMDTGAGDATLDATPTDPDAAPDANADAEAPIDADGADAAPIPCDTDCKDSFPCTEDRCVNGECVHEPYTGARECDGVACTQNDQCESGNCMAGTPNHAACPDDGNPCTAETCRVGTGCSRQNAPSTTSCNDNIGCTGSDKCNNGICRGMDMCTPPAVCSAATGSCRMCSNDNDCNDGDPCTGVVPGAGQAPVDKCNNGTCNRSRNVGLTGVCTDNKSCTANDACTASGCAGTSTCPGDATCDGSSCSCNDGDEDYCSNSNSCADLTSDAANCGQCNRACGNGGSCERSACKPSDASACTAWRYNGHEYLICPAVNNNSTWTWARDKCKSWGLSLAIIDNVDENNFLKDNAANTDHWMAANDRGDNGRCGDFLGCDVNSRECTTNAEEGTWYWANNTNENFRKLCTSSKHGACTPEPGAYTNFRGPNEPNNDGCNCNFLNGCNDGEDCGMVYADGSWNDSRCSTILGFICETP